jgi:hypothetical protein
MLTFTASSGSIKAGGMSQSLAARAVETGATEFISVEQVSDPHVKIGAAYWRLRCGQSKFPARAELTLRGLAAVLPFSVIVSVVDNGADYEYRYVGDAQRAAFKTSFKGVRVSKIEDTAPELGALLRGAYDMVRSTGIPFAVRGRADYGAPGATPLFHETAFLPLGVSDDAVDHLLIVGVQVPEPFWDIPEDTLSVFEEQLLQVPNA